MYSKHCTAMSGRYFRITEDISSHLALNVGLILPIIDLISCGLVGQRNKEEGFDEVRYCLKEAVVCGNFCTSLEGILKKLSLKTFAACLLPVMTWPA